MADPTSNRSYDLIVVGLGAMGSAALYHGARAGLTVLGIDRFDPPHRLGSTHAETRITRLAVGEGEQYLPFVARSHQIWRELEADTEEQLFFQSGGYIITPPSRTEDARWGGFVDRTARIAHDASVAFEVRDHTQVKTHMPRIQLRGDEVIGFEPTAGVVLCERAIAVQLERARRAGATTSTDTTVTAVRPAGAGATVVAGDTHYWADRVIVATGPWFPELAPDVDAEAVRVTRQVVFWFDVDDPEDFNADRFPFVMWPGHTIADYSAVFPRTPNARPGLKLLGEQFTEATTPQTVDRAVAAAEVERFYERLVRPRLHGVRPTVLGAEVCLYTNTADDHFLITTHPESEHILYASPCSGHGFKHSTALGEAMVAALTGRVGVAPLTPFVRR